MLGGSRVVMKPNMTREITSAKPVEAAELIRRNPPRNLSLQEAAWYLGFSKRKLRYEIAEGRIQAVRFGRRVILRLKDLDAALERNAY